jgi:hypothetical protein
MYDEQNPFTMKQHNVTIRIIWIAIIQQIAIHFVASEGRRT